MGDCGTVDLSKNCGTKAGRTLQNPHTFAGRKQAGSSSSSSSSSQDTHTHTPQCDTPVRRTSVRRVKAVIMSEVDVLEVHDAAVDSQLRP